ncbi:MAG TPA: hypothetical protein VN802_01890 [Stellaceae bacterium]|nr:hypothetical protein [Stellaceae bacterium]
MPRQEDSEAHEVEPARPLRLAPAPRLDVVALGSLLLDIAARNERQVVVLIRSDDGTGWYDYRPSVEADDALVGKLTAIAHEVADYLNSSNGRKP